MGVSLQSLGVGTGGILWSLARSMYANAVSRSIVGGVIPLARMRFLVKISKSTRTRHSYVPLFAIGSCSNPLLS